TPSATASTAPGLGYAEDIVTLLALAQYIRSLGYQAVACQNDTVLSIPLAIKAGLGEYGRHGMVITKDFGPRARFGTVLTDLPLAHDRPTAFGVAETCRLCRRCANNCPPQAIDHGDPSDRLLNVSVIKGVRKWTTDPEKCFGFWVGQGTDCAICIRTCPYNKDFSKWYFRLGRFLLGTPLRRLILHLDDKLRLHDRQHPLKWWGGEPDGARPENRPSITRFCRIGPRSSGWIERGRSLVLARFRKERITTLADWKTGRLEVWVGMH
ncbi:MAG: reductive dehalogenase domain-containing protein, partial [Anaerolineae bacterium]|nr:reductive dehalogenase domain-containing protein [Anaerolineae bacterium]